MAEIITSDVKWKVGERGNQIFFIYDSDGKALHDLTGMTYNFKIWDEGTDPPSLIGGGPCAIVGDPTNGEVEYPVTATDTDTEAEYLGEIVEDLGAVEKRTNTFKVEILPSSKDLV